MVTRSNKASFLQYYALKAVVSHAAQMIRLRSHHVAADFCAVRNSIASTARRTAPAPCAHIIRFCWQSSREELTSPSRSRPNCRPSRRSRRPSNRCSPAQRNRSNPNRYSLSRCSRSIPLPRPPEPAGRGQAAPHRSDRNYSYSCCSSYRSAAAWARSGQRC